MARAKVAKGSIEWYRQRRDLAEDQVEQAVKSIARTVTSVKFWRKRVSYFDRVIRKLEAASREVGPERKRRKIVLADNAMEVTDESATL